MIMNTKEWRWTLALWICLLVVVSPDATWAVTPTEQATAPFSNYVGLLTASNMPTVTAFHAIHDWKATLQLPMLRNGVVYSGANARMRRVITKLLNGEPTSIGVIGGSISWGHGVQRGKDDWFSLFTSYLKNAFPRAAITAKNGCVPATHSEFVSMCINHFVDAAVDLVFIEFTTNDGYLDTSVNNAYSHAFERLVRKLLKFPNSPAVVLMNFLHSNVKKNNLPFYHTIEDHYGVLSQYYQLPWLSVRDAVWHGLINDWEGFRAQDLYLAAEVEHSQRHPNELGHKYMADLAVGLMQQTYLELMLLPLTHSDAIEGDKVPNPMFPGNVESKNMACATGLDFKGAVSANHTDWYFVNEGTSQKPKWGYMSYIPTATLVLQLDTRATGAQPIPQLTLLQKVQLLQQQGMFAAAAQLQAAAARAAARTGSTVAPAAAAVAAVAAAAAAPGPTQPLWGGDGLQAAMQEVERQAQAAAAKLRTGELQAYAAREVLVGAQNQKLELPADAREVGASTTATGVEVVMNNAGRKLLTAAAAAPPAAAAARGTNAESDARMSTASSKHASTSSSSGMDHASSGSTSSSSSRLLLSEPSPYAVPAPYDAVHLKPSAGTSILSALGQKANSLAQADMLVWIGYLKSYRMMGRARIHCISGCVCHETVVDGWHASATSQTVMAKLRVTQHAECRIGVEVLEDTSTGHHKFKVTGVMISKAIEYNRADDNTETALMGAIEEASASTGGPRGLL